MQKDFSYPLKIDELSQNRHHYHLKANAEECLYLKEILELEGVQSFEADFILKKHNKTNMLDVEGNLKAVVLQQSVISLEVFEKEYQVPFAYHFDTKMTYNEFKDMDYGINDDAPDIIENGQIDLVQMAIEQLALCLDDYPRQTGETFNFVSEFDEETTKRANPFSVLQNLKK